MPSAREGRGGPSGLFCTVRRGVGHRQGDEAGSGSMAASARRQRWLGGSSALRACHTRIYGSLTNGAGRGRNRGPKPGSECTFADAVGCKKRGLERLGEGAFCRAQKMDSRVRGNDGNGWNDGNDAPKPGSECTFRPKPGSECTFPMLQAARRAGFTVTVRTLLPSPEKMDSRVRGNDGTG